MSRSERNVLIATAGLAVVAVGAFLPWARIGGRDRSGFDTADTFIALSEGVLPAQVAWVGRWWYLPVFFCLAAWASTFFAARRWLRALFAVLLALGLAMWWVFVWAGRRYGVLDSQFIGPALATVGIALIGTAAVRVRESLIRTHRSV